MAKNQKQQAKAKAQRMLAAGKSQERVAAKTGLAPQRVERIATRVEPTSSTRTPSTPSNELTQFGVNNNFGGAAFNAARSAGLSVEDIERLAPTSGLNVGEGVKWILENEQNFPSYEGGAGSALAGQDVRSQAYFAPNAAFGRFGPNENIVLAASPNPKPYAETLKSLNDRFWNPTEAEKQKYYDNYQDDLSGGIMPTQQTYTPQFGKYKAADMPMTKGEDWYHPSRMAGSNLPSAVPAQQTNPLTSASQAASISQKEAKKALVPDAGTKTKTGSVLGKARTQDRREQAGQRLLQNWIEAVGSTKETDEEPDFLSFLPGSLRYPPRSFLRQAWRASR